jgi:hypothetical protein
VGWPPGGQRAGGDASGAIPKPRHRGGLFVRGDFAPEAAEGAAPTIPGAERWTLFREVARSARARGIELQSLYWTALFEEPPEDDGAQGRMRPDLGAALQLLYDLGHHSALLAGAEFLLEPLVDGEGRLDAVLRDEGVRSFLRIARERPPVDRPERRKRRDRRWSAEG